MILGGYVAWKFFYGSQGEMNTERTAAFAVGMRLTDPVKINLLADAFQKGGLPDQATQLRNRANLTLLPADVQAQRAAVLKKALNSTNPDAIDLVGDAFESQGLTNTADILHAYATGLRNNSQIAPAVIPQQTPANNNVAAPAVVDTPPPAATAAAT
jgi:hypothetical protein